MPGWWGGRRIRSSYSARQERNGLARPVHPAAARSFSSTRRAMLAPQSQDIQTTGPSKPPSRSPQRPCSVKKAFRSVSKLTAGSLPQQGDVRDDQVVKILRRHRSSATVQPRTLTFSHRLVAPPCTRSPRPSRRSPHTRARSLAPATTSSRAAHGVDGVAAGSGPGGPSAAGQGHEQRRRGDGLRGRAAAVTGRSIASRHPWLFPLPPHRGVGMLDFGLT
jgi:hypothetical protein